MAHFMRDGIAGAVCILMLTAYADNPLTAAIELENAGKKAKAFSAYLGIPGMEHAAVRLGREDAKRYLDICYARPEKDQEVSTWLVTGDLLLSMGGEEEALNAYRKAARLLNEPRENDGDAGTPVPEYYPVDPPKESRSQYSGVAYSPQYPLLPFQIGPGSHRDNWLIRRFVALKATDDAAREFARVWELHRFRTQPYVVDPGATGQGSPMQFPLQQLRQQQPMLQAQADVDQPAPDVGMRLITPAGFDRYGLQFALDYAYFLQRENRQKESLAVLFEALAAVDLDRNPNISMWGPSEGKMLTVEEAEGYPRRPPSFQRFHPYGNPVGISRKAFSRLAFGAFKDAIGSDVLVKRLQESIKSAENPRDAAKTRQVLARMLFLAGDRDGALAEELAYIDTPQLGFSDWTKACRRGLIYDEVGMLADAAAEYEKAQGLAPTPDELPDSEEEDRQGLMMSSMPVQTAVDNRRKRVVDLTGNLIRLYTALGEEDKLLQLSLQQLAEDPKLLADYNHLLGVRKRFQVARHEKRFTEWAKQQIKDVQPGTIDADRILLSLAIVTDDMPMAAEKAAGIVAREESEPTANAWAGTFRRFGDEAFQLYVDALVRHDIKNPRLQLTILDWQGDIENNPRALELLAHLLDLENANLFAFGKGNYRRTTFRNYFDIAYRVMRGYQKQHDMEKFTALGLRVARGAKPFGQWWEKDLRNSGFRDGNDLPEDLNGCLSLFVQYADSATLKKLSVTWRALPDFPAKRQLARRLQPAEKSATPPNFGWIGVPDDVKLIASNENVLCLAADGDTIYAGMPWGLAVYKRDGTPVTRQALGRAVQDILLHQGVLWCATPTGLLRVDPKSWEIQELPTDTDLDKPDAERMAFNRGVWKMAADGDSIWIGTRRNIQCYDTRLNTLRVFSQEHLGVDSHHDWERFIITESYVWAEGDGILLRFDRASQTWSRPQSVGEGRNPRPVGLIGFFDGQLWGHVWLNNKLRDRPCIIDPDTLAVTPVLIDDSLSSGERCINGPFSIYGAWDGAPVLGPGYPRFYYDADSAILRTLPTDKDGRQVSFNSLLPAGLTGGRLRINYDKEFECDNDMTHDLKPIPGMQLNTGRWVLLRLDEDTLLLGARIERSPRYQYPSEDWPGTYETGDDEGGLYLLKKSPDAENYSTLRISQTTTADSILSDTVFEFLPPTAKQPGWLCTGRGVVHLTDDLRVGATYTRADGLCANRVVDGLRIRAETFFATGWGDHGGGLLKYDPETRVFTSFVQSDGLATDKLADLEAKGNRIGLLYDCEYGRGSGYRYRRFPPAEFDPETATVSGNGEPSYADRSNDAGFADALIQTRRERRPAPFLGGFIIAEHSFQGKRVLCTTRGVVIMERNTKAGEYKSISPQIQVDPTLAMIREALNTPMRITTENLATYVDSDNGYLAARAVAGVAQKLDNEPELIPIVGRCLNSPVLRARSTALYVLLRSDRPEVVPFLRQACKDSDQYIGNVAAIALLSRGKRPDDEQIVERLFQQAGQYGGFPYNVTSSVGCLAEFDQVYHAIAPHANAADFAIMLRHPFPFSRTDKDEVFAALGASLRAHPEAAATLLQAYDTDSPWYAVQFAARTLAAAGEEILPTLRQALKSEDRVVRSNAARACGYLGNAALVPDLTTALDLESGLSRASIVWALGELKAIDAVPQLTELYDEAMADEKRRAGSGYRIAQQMAVMQNQFANISSVNAISEDWNELTRTKLDPPIDPQRNEDLLKPQHILNAVASIGPARTQSFYRKIAGSTDTYSRLQAAIHLAECPQEDQDENRTILRSMLGDADKQVEIAAAASVILLADDNQVAENRLAEALNAERTWEINHALAQLARLKEAKQLRPFVPRLRELAKGNPKLRIDRYTRERAQNLLRDFGLKETSANTP